MGTETSLEIILRFLSDAMEATRIYAEELHDRESESIYYEQERKLMHARHALLAEHYPFETWITTGKYEVPEIK